MDGRNRREVRRGPERNVGLVRFGFLVPTSEYICHKIHTLCLSLFCDVDCGRSRYLNSLGLLANIGHSCFCRQDLVGGAYGLLRDRYYTSACECTVICSLMLTIPAF